MAVRDLGGLGDAEGAPVYESWTPPSPIPALFPWLLIAGLLLLPGNRRPGAWWVFAPLVVVTGIMGIVLRVAPAQAQVSEMLDAAVTPVAFGLAATWALSHLLSGKPRIVIGLLFLLTAEFFTVVALLLPNAVYSSAEMLLQKLVIAVLAVFVIWLALGATALLLRGAYRPVYLIRFVVGAITLLSATIFAGMVGIISLLSGQTPPLGEVLKALLIIVSLLVCATLPFIMLSLSNTVYRQRLKGMFKLELDDRPVSPEPVLTKVT